MHLASLCESLGRLHSHADASRIALTGGVAIGLHLGIELGRRASGVEAEDIDLVAAGPDVVRASVTRDFLVSHFHLPQQGYAKFMIQLVDPVTRLRIDIFPDSLDALPRSVTVAAIPFPVLDAADILHHKLATLAKSSPANPDEPKHYDDVVQLSARLGRPVPAVPTAHLRAGEYSRDVDAVCARCTTSQRPEFPLADKREILAILGYV